MIYVIFLVASVFADLDCSGNQDYFPPADITAPIYFPPTWTPNQPPPPFGILQSCQFTLKIPQGMYAEVKIHKNSGGSEVTCTYPNLAVENVADMDTNPYIFTSPQAIVAFKANAVNEAFAFELNWKKFPAYPTNTPQLSQNGYPNVFKATDFLTVFQTVDPNSKVSLVAFNLNDNTLLRQSVILDGGSMNSLFIGTLSQVLTSGKPLVSTTNTMSIYSFGLNTITNGAFLYMGTDYRDTAHFGRYTGHNCKSATDCSFLLSADIQPSAVVTAFNNGPEYIKNMTLDPATTLSIYKNGVQKDNLITTYSNDRSYQNQLPIQLRNTIHQYTLESGRAFVQLSRDASDAKWNIPYDGRTGVMQSMYYDQPSYNQDMSDYLNTGDSEGIYLTYLT